ncbi:MAG: Flp pilus assembly complex ATPase component TadA [Bacteriovoracaceae bacterium]|nr:Flp pilus assembly complex ATPase component TadA [Bacteriovoracaceae bacterium]
MNFEQIENQKEIIRNKIAKGLLIAPEALAFEEGTSSQLTDYIKQWYTKLYNFEFIEHSNFEEQIFHSPDHIQINSSGCKLFDGADATQEDFQLSLDMLCLKKSITWNCASPFVSFDLNLKNQSFRASLLHYSICKEHGSKMFLRSIAPKAWSLNDFYDENFLTELVNSKKNVLVSGATGSGKTSLLNSMLEVSSKHEHLVILEDTCELLCPHENTTRLLARTEEEDDLKNFMAHAMRMSPDRIVLGELRSTEVESFLLAMNSGHKGLLSTIHANSAVDAVSRVALLTRLYSKNPLDYSLVLKLVSQNIDYVVYMKDKKVVEVIEIFGSESEQLFYERLDKETAAQKAAIGF